MCTSCQTSYYLATSSSCVGITPIPLCVTYNSAKPTTTCEACSTGYYVSGNVCVPRLNGSIAGCYTFSPKSDTCAVCNTGFIISSNGLTCLGIIANCATQSVSNIAVSCTACKPTFYWNSTDCVAGGISFCSVYTNANTCYTCIAGYYLSSNIC